MIKPALRFPKIDAFKPLKDSRAGTDFDLKRRYEDGLMAYRTQFVGYANKRTYDSPGGSQISFSSNKGMTIGSPRNLRAFSAPESACTPVSQPIDFAL